MLLSYERYCAFLHSEFPHSDISGSKVAWHLPEAYRRHAASFIAFLSLGIHHTPLFVSTLPFWGSLRTAIICCCTHESITLVSFDFCYLACLHTHKDPRLKVVLRDRMFFLTRRKLSESFYKFVIKKSRSSRVSHAHESACYHRNFA